jgi:hypothetical protein
MISFFNINKMSESWTGDFRYPYSRTLYLKAVALYLLFHFFVFWLPNASDYWGAERLLLPYYKTTNPLLFPFNLLEKYTFEVLWKLFFFSIFPLCLWVLWQPLSWWVWACIYFVTANLFHATAALQNAGMNTLLISLLLNLFMVPLPFEFRSLRFSWFRNALSHLGFFMILFQVVLLYLVASIAKLEGSKWMEGTAFYYVLMNDMYSHPFFRDAFAGRTWLIQGVSWFTLAFQLSFPVLVWFRYSKILLLFLGMVFHLMILWVMGIEDFGLIMMMLYILFLGEERVKKIMDFLRLRVAID